MKERDDLPVIVIERHSGGFQPFLWGALVGAGVALLLAPRSGAQTQDDIRNGVQRLRSTAEDRIFGTRDSVLGVVDRARETVQERVDSVRDLVSSRTSRAKQAVDAGRQAATDARSELRERLDEAKRAANLGDAAAAGDPLGADAAPIIVEADVLVADVHVEEPRGPYDGLS